MGVRPCRRARMKIELSESELEFIERVLSKEAYAARKELKYDLPQRTRESVQEYIDKCENLANLIGNVE